MKKNLLILIFVSGVLTCAGQDSIAKNIKISPNEIGIDGTAFFRQFLNFGKEPGSNDYIPSYFLTYRRIFKTVNIRAALGGSFSQYEITPLYYVDSNKYSAFSYSISSRIGCEFFRDLSQRWRVFYGLDFRPGFFYSRNDAVKWEGGYANGFETEKTIYGIAPMLGFRFKIINNLYLSTETNFSFNIEQSKNKQFFLPVNAKYLPIPDIETSVSKLYTIFDQPLSIFVTIGF